MFTQTGEDVSSRLENGLDAMEVEKAVGGGGGGVDTSNPARLPSPARQDPPAVGPTKHSPSPPQSTVKTSKHQPGTGGSPDTQPYCDNSNLHSNTTESRDEETSERDRDDQEEISESSEEKDEEDEGSK